MPYTVRLMRRQDIAQVAQIDHEAFPTMWPPMDFRQELKNPIARYIVACDENKTVEIVEPPPRKGLSAALGRVRHLFDHDRFYGDEVRSPEHYVVGFAGFWVMADEAHLTNIALRETYRGQRIGELLLIASIDLARELRARFMTLEVRASNTVAQALYQKYGFKQVGLRPAYYIDNKEDALYMSTSDISSPEYQVHFADLKRQNSEKLGVTEYRVGR